MATNPIVDYVVVGAGSAGCVLANRLSEERDTTVLLLEAGGRDTKREIHIPAAWPQLFKSEVDWAFVTEEQRHLNGRRLYWPRGKVLGGTSSVNALIYTIGNRRDFDLWQRDGNAGWDFASVEPYFRHSALRFSAPRPGHLLSRTFLDACGQAGIPPNEDFAGPDQEGAGLFQVTVHNGKRCSAAVAYLQPAMSRPNLTVRTNSLATRVVFEQQRAAGVEYVEGGRRSTVSARREVILSSGAIKSPQLLLLSGVGPSQPLRSLGIPVVTELAGVGRNLRDHLLAGVVHECTKPISMADAGTPMDIAQFMFHKKGRLCSNVAEAGAFLRTRDGLDRPDIELIFAPAFYMSHGFLNPKGHGFSIGVVLQHARSEGQIALKSADPLEAPLIEPNYLSAGEDIDTLVTGVKAARRVARARAFDPYRGKELWPGETARTDDDLVESLRKYCETLYHPMGTCRMGNDAMAVVDERLRVRGTERLRVVDASIMPRTITGHPNAVVVMCAEKAAAMIREDARRVAAPSQVI